MTKEIADPIAPFFFDVDGVLSFEHFQLVDCSSFLNLLSAEDEPIAASILPGFDDKFVPVRVPAW